MKDQLKASIAVRAFWAWIGCHSHCHNHATPSANHFVFVAFHDWRFLGEFAFAVRAFRDRLPRMKMQNKSVEVNGRGGVCRSFHVIREFDLVAGWRCPPAPHLLRSRKKVP